MQQTTLRYLVDNEPVKNPSSIKSIDIDSEQCIDLFL